jgi:hypothetical protein
VYEVTDDMPRHARVILLEPEGGWTRVFYDQQIDQYALDRGAPPRTVTLHPETLATLGFGAARAKAMDGLPRDPILIASGDYARGCITLFE